MPMWEFIGLGLLVAAVLFAIALCFFAGGDERKDREGDF